MEELENFVASKLLKIKAVKMQPNNPFVWATGWNSPIYCDDRKLLSYPAVRNVVKLEMARLVAEKFPDAEVIASVATNAIAIGVLVAEELGLPFVYVHPRPKDHGFENMIEGDLKPKQKVVIIEDQICMGNNSLRVVDVLKKNACKVLGLVAIYNYEFEAAATALKSNQVEAYWLCGFEAMISKALENKIISPDDEKVFRQWQANPSEWKK